MPNQPRPLFRKYYLDKDKRVPLPAHVKSNVKIDVQSFKPLKLLLVLVAIVVLVTFLKWQVLSMTERVTKSAAVSGQQQQQVRTQSMVHNRKSQHRTDHHRELIGFQEVSNSYANSSSNNGHQNFNDHLQDQERALQTSSSRFSEYETSGGDSSHSDNHSDSQSQGFDAHTEDVDYDNLDKKLNVVTAQTLYNKLHGIEEEKVVDDGLAFHEIERWKTTMPRIDTTSPIPGDGSGNYLKKPAIVVFCYNRPEYLQKTLNSLSQLRLLEEFAVYVSQDGDDDGVSKVAKEMGAGVLAPPRTKVFEHWQHPRLPLLGEKQPGHAWLAQHYRWALDRVFLQKDHSHVIIVEDDMLFSPDFLQYFKATAVLLELDPTLWCVSSWNDNGVGNFDWQPDRLFRTSFFPGLGWMMSQKTWHEIGSTWPLENWDHWMRLETTNLGRQCVVPEVNRNFNIGEKGANMNKSMYRRYLSKMMYNQNNPVQDFGDLSYLLKPNYDKILQEQIAKATVIKFQGSSSIPGDSIPKTYLILYEIENYKSLSRGLAVWPFPRGHYNHLTVLPRRNGQVLLLADVRLCPLLDGSLRKLPTRGLFPEAADRGEDCDDACARHQARCSLTDFQFINSCMQLQQKFPCERGCGLVLGPDVPNYVMNDELDTHRQCLVNEAQFKCSGKHEDTARLCPCVKNSQQ